MNRTEADALKRIPVSPFRISNGALASEELPKRLKIANWGRNDSAKGPVIVDDQSVAAFAANQRALGYDRVAIDYEHNTVPGCEAYKAAPEPRPVAGYATPRIIPNDGLYLEDIQWTPSGVESARNYADLSPAPRQDKSGRVLFLHSVALCRNGALYDLSFFSAQPSTNEPEPPMPDTDLAAISAQLQTLNTTLTGLDARLKTLEERKPEITTLSVAGTDGKVTVLNVADLVGRVAGIETKLTATQTAAENAEKATLVSRFAAEGKAPLGDDGKPMSGETLQTFSAGELKRLLANTPPTVPLSARGRRPAEGRDDTLKGVARAAAALERELAAS